MPKPVKSPVKSGWKAHAEKMKQDLLKRTQESTERQKEGGSTRGSIFIKEKVANLPFYEAKKGEHIIDIVPFIAGRLHPRDAEGEWSYVVDLWVHYNVGPENMPIVCPKRNFDKRCPICEHMQKTRLEKADWDAIRPKRRTVYLVWPHDEEGKLEKIGVHIWDVSHYFFENHIDELAKKPRGGGFVIFHHPSKEEGKQIRFIVKSEGSFTTKDGQKVESKAFSGHQFLDRDADLPDKIMDQAMKIHLDELINMRINYDDINKIFMGDEEEDEPADETPSEEPAEDEPTEEPEEQPEEEPAEEAETDDFDGMDRSTLKKFIVENDLKDKVKVLKSDSDDDLRNKIRAVYTPTEDEEDETEDVVEEETSDPDPHGLLEMDRDALKKFILKTWGKDNIPFKILKSDSDDDLREKINNNLDDEPKSPKPAAKGKAKATKKSTGAKECPAGGKFGKDVDQLEECIECKIYDECTAASEA